MAIMYVKNTLKNWKTGTSALVTGAETGVQEMKKEDIVAETKSVVSWTLVNNEGAATGSF